MSINNSVKMLAVVATFAGALASIYAARVTYLVTPEVHSDPWSIEPDVGTFGLTHDIQNVLRGVGLYSGKTDADLNTETIKAILKAEKIFDMELTGSPSEGLYLRLAFFEQNKDLVKTLQELFADRGEFESVPTGNLDNRTIDLLARAWRQYGLEEWSLIDRELLVALIFKIGADNLDNLEFAASNPQLHP